MPALRPVGLEDIASAPIVVEVVADLAAPRQRVFDLLAGDPGRWSEFGLGLDQRGHWIEQTPEGVGSVRSIGRGKARFVERILAHDDGKRWAFRVERAPVFGTTALIEDYVVEDAPGGCTVRWTGAVWPVGPAALARPVVSASLKTVIRRLLNGVERTAR